MAKPLPHLAGSGLWWSPSPGGQARPQLLVTGLVLLAFLLRLHGLDFESLWLDEVDTLAFATQQIDSLLGMFTMAAQNGPLYYLMLRPWIALAGTSEFALRYSSLLAGVLAVPLIYALGRRLLSSQVGVWGAVVAAFSPYYIWYSQEGKMYALLAAITLLSMYLFLGALQGDGLWRWLAYALVTAAGPHVHLFFIFVMVTQGVLFLAFWGRYRHAAKGWALAQVLILGPYLPLASWQVPALLSGYPTAFQPIPLSTELWVLFSRFSLHTEMPASPLLLFPFALLSLVGLLAHRQDTPEDGTETSHPSALQRATQELAGRSGVVWLIISLTVPVALHYLVAQQVPAFMHRYFAIITPAYYLLLACGLAVVRRWAGWWGLGAAISTILVISLAPLPRPDTFRPDFRGAVRYVQTHLEPGDGIGFVADYGGRAFAYYHPLGENWIRLPYTNDGKPEPIVFSELEGATAGYRRIWLLLSEEWLWDARSLTQGWLEQRGTLVQARRLTGVTVLCYALRWE